jgi:aminopeptidase
MRLLFAALAALALPCTLASAQTADVARVIVEQSADIQPGERVLVSGTPDQLALLGQIEVEVAKRGGQPLVVINNPETGARMISEMPEAYLDRPWLLNLSLYDAVDASIDASSDAGAAYANVPEERLARFRNAQSPIGDLINQLGVRSVALGQTGGILSDAYAQRMGGDPALLRTTFWQAVAVSPDALKARADQVAARLAPNALVRYTRAGGTNLTFTLGAQAAIVNTGRVSDVAAGRPPFVYLPAGEGFTCINPTSANGTLIVPFTEFRGAPIRDLRLTIRNGVVTSFASPSDTTALRTYFATASAGGANLSLISLGVNPQSRMLPGSQHRSWEMSGMTTLVFGSSTWAGCDYASSFGAAVHVDGATVDVGGQTIVRAGALLVQ